MDRMLEKWHGMDVGVTVGKVYSINSFGEFLDDNGDRREGACGVWVDVYGHEHNGVNDAGEATDVSIDDTLNERGKRYGTFKGHARLSQTLLATILNHTTANDVKLSEVHREALQMICHKIARIANGDPNYDDSWRDIAGYAQLVVKHLNGEDV